MKYVNYGNTPRLNYGNTRILVTEYYEIRRLDSDLSGRTWWNTVKTARTEKKAIRIAKGYELGGRRVQVIHIIDGKPAVIND